MVKRDLYLKKLLQYKNQPLIKVLTGMRRVGKSTLLKLLAEELVATGVARENIVYLNLELATMDDIADYRALYRLLKGKLPVGERGYLLLDEVQLIDGWERAVNALLAEDVADIYLTGSNARMLSSELATLLSGRYVTIEVYPLSFREYLDFRAGATESRERLFRDYLRFGAMPLVPNLEQDNAVVESVLSGIYDTVLMKDIVARNAVRDPALLEGLVRFLADNIGSPITTSKICGYLTSKGRKTNSTTVDNYLKMLESAYIFYRAQRYDIRGKMYLKTQEKYYIVDNGIRNMLLGFRGGDYGHVLENIVYLELRRRGYTVHVGKLGSLEIDFVATKSDRKIYYQVSATVLDDNTRERELAPLRSVPDYYEKVLLTMDDSYITDFEGIKNINIIDFLLSDE